MKASQITASVFVKCLLSLSLFAPGTLRALAYQPLKAEIPVFCREVTGTDIQNYQITVKPETEQTPAPVSGTLTVSENSSGKFEIEITEPGTYRYTISETAGGDSGITYDDSVYEVTLFVENGEADTLVCAVTANLAGKAEKADLISFCNIGEELPVTVTTTETATTESTTEPVTAFAATTAGTLSPNPAANIIQNIKTGDSFPVRTLCLGIFAAMTAALSAVLFRRKNTEKEGGQ